MLRQLTRRLHREEPGFTLLEIFAVLLIIGVLAAIALPVFLNHRMKGQDADAKSNVRNMVSELESCYSTIETYVGCDTSKEVLDSNIPLGSGAGQVNLTTLAANRYEIVGQSASGNHFTITKLASGPLSRTCITAGQGACPSSGDW
jgi:type IV pilus assembly protein PilA